MATQNLSHVVLFPQTVPARKLSVASRRSSPRSFQQALRDGWTILREITTLGVDKRHRHGAVILAKDGHSEKLKVPYTGTIRQGYRFGKPQLA
jgi:hypothetical protein